MAKSIIRHIGSMVPAFKEEKIMILFGPMVPNELKDYTVVHEFMETPKNPLKEGRKIQFGNHVFEITKLGSIANKNLQELGHISIYFRHPLEDVLPGAVYVKPHRVPDIQTGTIIHFK